MSEEQLSQKIQSLSINDEQFAKLLTKFKSKDELSKEEQVELYNHLLEQSQLHDNSKIIYELLIDTPLEFLKYLHRINDKSGNLIVSALNQNKPSDALVQSLFSNLRLIIKSDHADIAFYLGIYSSLVTHLKSSNPQHLNLFLTFVDGKNAEVQQGVFVLIIQNLKLQKEETSSVIKEYLEVLMDDISLDYNGFLNFVTILEICFPIVPEICTGIYRDDKTKAHLLDRIDSIAGGSNLTLAIPILKLIDASAIVENCRNYSVTNYFLFLSHAFETNNTEIQVVASLTLGKLWKVVQFEKKQTEITTESLAEVLVDYVKNPENNSKYVELAVEGLMYLSLYWQVRDLMRMDVLLIEVLLTKLEETSINSGHMHTSLQYGLLSIFSTLTKLKDINDRESNMNTKKQLRNVATPKNGSDSDQEDQEAIKLFNRELLNDDKIISKISTLKSYKSTASSNNSLNEVIKIIYHLSSDQQKSTRVELVKQGALNIVLNYLISFSEITKKDHLVYAVPNTEDANVMECRVLAIRSLARMLIAVDPKTSFTKYDVHTAIPFLKELLGPDITQYQSESPLSSNTSYLNDMTLLDRFESLLALTNIAATATPELKQFLIQQFFENYLDNMIVSSEDAKIQQASWELIANLINEPLMLAKFFNLEVKANAKRLDLLVKLLNSTNEGLQVVIAGLLANATDFDMIAEVLVSSQKVFDELVDLISDILLNEASEHDLVLPTSYLLVNLVYAAANCNPAAFAKLSSNTKLKSACTNILRTGENDTKEAIMEVIKMCRFK
ncbi:SWI5-dependent HO expression protein 4 [Candida viswanathii]|uniref:SWI5-dependent HO expression protein 4 n=1 Tax=Candida viswanathii TaxID=5486 RepID=A0A367YMR3_9ASCO|nr:SWI5-dependent HO expression protein 4 [Candida viswanathii]